MATADKTSEELLKYRIIFFMALVPNCVSLIYAQTVVFHEFESVDADYSLENLLYLHAAVELSEMGYSSSRTNDSADFILIVNYSNSGANLDVEYNFSQIDDEEAESLVLTRELVLDFSLSTQVKEIIASLVPPLVSDEDVGSIGSILDIQNSKTQTTDEASSITAVTPSPETGESDTLQVQPNNRIASEITRENHFGISLKSPLYVFLGKAGKYFTLGVGGALDVHHEWRAGAVGFSAGIESNYHVFIYNPDADGSNVHLAGVGPRLSILFGKNSVQGELSISGGWSGLLLQTESGFLVKSLPYFGVELGMQLYMSKHLDLVLGMGMRKIINEELPFTAVLPFLGLHLGF